KRGGCSRVRLKTSKGQIVYFFEKTVQKNLHLKPLLVFILSVVVYVPKASLVSVTGKTTQNKKDTREISRIFYATMAPVNGKRFNHKIPCANFLDFNKPIVLVACNRFC